MNYLKQNYFGQFRNIKTISSIIILSVLSSLFSLVIPIAVQILVNYMIFGRMLYPIVFLSIIIFFVFIAYGIINLLQEFLIEVFQQKMFVDLSLNFSKKLNLFNLSFFENQDSYEAINKFFETTNIQKTFTAIIIYGTTLLFQLLIALALLASYHPYFILYDLLLIVGLYLSIKITFNSAVTNAVKLCQQKHVVASWFESMNKNFILFKFSSLGDFFIQKTDELLCHYLKARNMFFKYSIKQQMGLFFVGALATSSLLLLGGYLVINDKLSLGQLIASELILGGLVYTLKNLINILDHFYNLVGSMDKIEKIINPDAKMIENFKKNEFVQNHFLDLEATYDSHAFKIFQKETSLLIFKDLKTADDFILSLFGFLNQDVFNFSIAQMKCKQSDLMTLRSQSLVLDMKDFFVGTIYENLCLNHYDHSREHIYELFKEFDLISKLGEFSQGLDEVIYLWDKAFTDAELAKLLLIRFLILKPHLCVVNCILDVLDQKLLEHLHHYLKKEKSYVIVLSTKPSMENFFQLTLNTQNDN